MSTQKRQSDSRPWIRGLTMGSVLLVALVAAVVSYAHMYDLASRGGEGWRAWLIPLSVDGMLVASTLAIVDRRRADRAVGWVPWTGLSLGLVASLAANVAAAKADLVAQLVAAWPPVALAVSIETLVIVLRHTALDTSTPLAAPVPVPAAAVAAPTASAPAEVPSVTVEPAREVPPQSRPGRTAPLTAPAGPTAVPPRTPPRQPVAAAVGKRAAGIAWARGNWPATGNAIALAVGVSRAEGDRVRVIVRDERKAVAS